MPSLENIRSSRRNLMRMGAVVAAAVVAKTMPASADRPRWDDDRDDHDHHEHHHHEDRPRQKEHCFLKGTMIRTVHGDKKIEDLLVGDIMPTVFGGERRSNRSPDAVSGWLSELLGQHSAPICRTKIYT